MTTKTRATIEDLYKVGGKAELVNGEIVEMPPRGDDPNGASLNVAISLRAYEKRTGRGRAYTDGAGFLVHLPHWEVFSPDAAYHVGPRTGMRFKAPPCLPLSQNKMLAFVAKLPPCLIGMEASGGTYYLTTRNTSILLSAMPAPALSPLLERTKTSRGRGSARGCACCSLPVPLLD